MRSLLGSIGSKHCHQRRAHQNGSKHSQNLSPSYNCLLRPQVIREHYEEVPTSPSCYAVTSVHDELAVTDGLVFHGERLVIQKIMRSQIKKEVHAGHQGINTCLQRARYEQKVKEWIQPGEACREFKQTHCKETLMSHEDPRQAWEKISYDLVSYHGKDYRSLLQVQLLGA